MARRFKVTVTFNVKVEDNGKYPMASDVRKAIYDGIEIPGYMIVGLDVTVTGATVSAAGEPA